MTDDKLKLTKKKPTLIAFTAKEWCGPCQTFEKELPTLREFEEHFVIEQVDASTRRETILKWGVRSYPTLLMFTPNGERFYVFSSYVPKTAENVAREMQKVKNLKPEENLTFSPWDRSTKGLYIMVD